MAAVISFCWLPVFKKKKTTKKPPKLRQMENSRGEVGLSLVSCEWLYFLFVVELQVDGALQVGR